VAFAAGVDVMANFSDPSVMRDSSTSCAWRSSIGRMASSSVMLTWERRAAEEYTGYGGRGLTPQWLAVSMPRQANGDADRLSYPEMYEAVRADAEAAGLCVSRARLSEGSWDRLRAAARLRCGVEGAQLQLT